MRKGICFLALVYLVLHLVPVNAAEHRIKGFKDSDFLLLLKKGAAASEKVINGITGKFYYVTPPTACGDEKNPIVGYIYFANPGDCAPEQLIRLPLSSLWKMVDWTPKGDSDITAQIIREYYEGEDFMREEWHITGNGKLYRITKQKI